MLIEWYQVEPANWAANRSISDLQVRQQTGATIIAIIEPDGTAQINPGPEHIMQAGATLVVVGSREHIQTFKQLIAQGDG
jgi:TrkA domain protein